MSLDVHAYVVGTAVYVIVAVLLAEFFFEIQDVGDAVS